MEAKSIWYEGISQLTEACGSASKQPVPSTHTGLGQRAALNHSTHTHTRTTGCIYTLIARHTLKLMLKPNKKRHMGTHTPKHTLPAEQIKTNTVCCD